MGADVAEQPEPSVYVTEMVEVVETVIAAEVAAFDHVFPEAYEEVKVTLPPAQKVVAPLAVMVGEVGGVGSLSP
jgi:hypothetical protein